MPGVRFKVGGCGRRRTGRGGSPAGVSRGTSQPAPTMKRGPAWRWHSAMAAVTPAGCRCAARSPGSGCRAGSVLGPIFCRASAIGTMESRSTMSQPSLPMPSRMRRVLPQMCRRTCRPGRAGRPPASSRRARRTPRRFAGRPARRRRRRRRSRPRRPSICARAKRSSISMTNSNRSRTKAGSSKKSIIRVLMPRRSAASAKGPSIQPSIILSRRRAP